mgnify:CR=1 FL=1
MKNKNRYLILDFDGVLGDTISIIDQYVQKIDYEASDKREKEIKIKIIDLEKQIEDYDAEHASIERLSDLKNKLKVEKQAKVNHFNRKDLVLEEVLDEYKNIIPYHKIITIENMFRGVINLIKLIIKLGIYDKVYVLSHCNVQSEVDAKYEFLKRFLPDVEFIPVLFHQESYFDSDGNKRENRERTNKFWYFKNQTGIEDLSNSTFIDDTISIIEEAMRANVGYPYYRNGENDTLGLLTQDVKRLCPVKTCDRGKVYRKLKKFK